MKIAKVVVYSIAGVIVLSILAFASLLIYLYIADSTPKKWDADERWKMRMWAESEIQHVFADILIEDVEDLFFGGAAFCQMIVSFRMDSREVIELVFRKKGLEVQDFQKGELSSEGPWRHYHLPHEWDKEHRDSNWPLKEGDAFLYYGDDDELIIYTPKNNRVYVMINHFN